MLGALQKGPKVVGAKQSRRALADGSVARLFVAEDADPRLMDPLRIQAEEQGVPVESVSSMRALGEACGILVGAAVAALLKE
ncbi:MAG: ribosomal L7Ae/L30e/S12e/Gadd45 family protein [Oscillospiraceae bacterium]|jgi:large subunit ribosomal protein L7A|nr:ribosomal L7Ae/L30e/S12e/Gadd45 family protein [Oscillospiraceae bacterium]